MPPRSKFAVLLLLALSGCKGTESAIAAANQEGTPFASIGQPAPPPWKAPQISPHELCRTPLNACLLLWQVPVERASDAWCKTCSSKQCDAGWLASAGRAELVYAQNCIYALHGFIFKSSLLQERFSRAPWYAPRVGFDPRELSSLEVSNLAGLKQLELVRRSEQDGKAEVSAADKKRARDWLRALKKGTFKESPESFIAHGQAVGREDFLRAVPGWLGLIKSEDVSGSALDNGNMSLSISQAVISAAGQTRYILSFELDRLGALRTVEYTVTE